MPSRSSPAKAAILRSAGAAGVAAGAGSATTTVGAATVADAAMADSGAVTVAVPFTAGGVSTTGAAIG